MEFSGVDTDLVFGFNGWDTTFSTMNDGRVKAQTSVAGKAFEAFGSDEKHANNNLEQVLRTAVENKDIILNQR